MNKIIVNKDSIEKVCTNKNIFVEYVKKECIFGVDDIKITINKNTKLFIENNIINETKINFIFNIKKNTTLDLYIITHGIGGKVQYKYNIEEKSLVNLFKFQEVSGIKEMIIINLNGIDSQINYNFKTVSSNKETYDYHIFHKYVNSKSYIKNNGVTINNGSIIFQVSTFVPQKISGCVATQNNRIINLNESNCEILPNLYIDCNDIEASHNALIGKFSDEEIFYLMSRGITYNEAILLLTKGFLTSDIDDKLVLKEINKSIKKYWR